MKRSEMVERLKCFFVDEDWCNEADDDFATEIIDFLEQQGMLPPPYTFKQKVVNNPTGNTVSVTNYEWEDEE